jgi:hypothetical protein
VLLFAGARFAALGRVVARDAERPSFTLSVPRDAIGERPLRLFAPGQRGDLLELGYPAEFAYGAER